MLNTDRRRLTRFHAFPLNPRVALMGIKCYKFFHARLLSSAENLHQFNLMDGVALSYFHSGNYQRIVLEPRPPSHILQSLEGS
jgi:hypothetical protein